MRFDWLCLCKAFKKKKEENQFYSKQVLKDLGAKKEIILANEMHIYKMATSLYV